MINYINCEERLSAEEHFCLYIFYINLYNENISYKNFHIHEELVDEYNSLTQSQKREIDYKLISDPRYAEFISYFNTTPWVYEKPVIWSDRNHSRYFIEQLELSHSFEVFIDYQFKERGVDIGLYYGRDAQYEGETKVGIEIKYDAKSLETNNFYIEYKERMWRDGLWVNSGILKDDNTRFYLFGTMRFYAIFERERLMDYYNILINGEKVEGARLVSERAHFTSLGFIITPQIWRKINIPIDQLIHLL